MLCGMAMSDTAIAAPTPARRRTAPSAAAATAAGLNEAAADTDEPGIAGPTW